MEQFIEGAKEMENKSYCARHRRKFAGVFAGLNPITEGEQLERIFLFFMNRAIVLLLNCGGVAHFNCSSLSGN